MSKCQMKKYLAGGRCGGTSQESQKDTQGVSQAFSQMMAQRDAQIQSLFHTPLTNQNQHQQQQQQISVKQESIIQIPKSALNTKQSAIDIILAKDYDSE